MGKIKPVIVKAIIHAMLIEERAIAAVFILLFPSPFRACIAIPKRES